MSTTNFKDWWQPDCPYSKECSSKGYKCDSCKNNRRKKDFYVPTNPWTWPVYVTPPNSPQPTVTYMVTTVPHTGKK